MRRESFSGACIHFKLDLCDRVAGLFNVASLNFQRQHTFIVRYAIQRVQRTGTHLDLGIAAQKALLKTDVENNCSGLTSFFYSLRDQTEYVLFELKYDAGGRELCHAIDLSNAVTGLCLKRNADKIVHT